MTVHLNHHILFVCLKLKASIQLMSLVVFATNDFHFISLKFDIFVIFFILTPPYSKLIMVK